jgi:hypothetical protein
MMKPGCFLALMTISVASLPLQPALALAQHERPFLGAYFAPTPGCPSSDAFQALLRAEAARSWTSEPDWQFSVRIVQQDGLYAGTLTPATGGVRTITAARCDDVTAALAVIIAVLEPSSPAPAEQVLRPADAPPPPPRRVDIVQPNEHGLGNAGERSRSQWRVGARGLSSTHPSWGSPNVGGLGVVSLELPWGFRKMMFEVGAGMAKGTGPEPPAITYLIFDTQACLLDLPIGNSGISVLGCLRLAGARYSAWQKQNPTVASPLVNSDGAAFWSGASARLRYQTPTRLFVEGNVDAMYGTVSRSENSTPGWFGVGLGVGVQIW